MRRGIVSGSSISDTNVVAARVFFWDIIDWTFILSALKSKVIVLNISTSSPSKANLALNKAVPPSSAKYTSANN
jgi:hypothetical protein